MLMLWLVTHGSWLVLIAHNPCMQDVPASVDGVLGGFGTVTDVDIKESDEFLTHLQDRKLLTLEPSSRAADCGAGILMITDKLIGCTCVKSSGCTDGFSACMGHLHGGTPQGSVASATACYAGASRVWTSLSRSGNGRAPLHNPLP